MKKFFCEISLFSSSQLFVVILQMPLKCHKRGSSLSRSKVIYRVDSHLVDYIVCWHIYKIFRSLVGCNCSCFAAHLDKWNFLIWWHQTLGLHGDHPPCTLLVIILRLAVIDSREESFTRGKFESIRAVSLLCPPQSDISHLIQKIWTAPSCRRAVGAWSRRWWGRPRPTLGRRNTWMTTDV